DHPDRIPVGVKLQIPSAKLYDIHAGSPASIKKARALQAQIMAKYPSRTPSYSPYQYQEQYGNYGQYTEYKETYPEYPPNYFY
ncbi:MAG: hypothetical protein LBQ39_03770, partial [Tannerellaceae bacterium]|nr:hypothetical protein [Tannerellaceae bacterium]